MQKGVTFLGYRIFYHHKLLRKRNLKHFFKNLDEKFILLKEGKLTKKDLIGELQGWFGYAQWANTYKLRRKIMKTIELELINKTH